jgi:hypothetical protein
MSDRHFRLSEPGRPFQVTDAGESQTLPRRRLIWAAHVADYFILHYEAGGRAHSYHVMVARCDSGCRQPRVVWSATAKPFRDYSTFLKALRRNELDDTLPYFF